MTSDLRLVTIILFYTLAMLLLFIFGIRITRNYNRLIKVLQEDSPEKWRELSDGAITMKSLYWAIFNFIWRGKIFRSARIALAVKQLRENYAAFFVVFFSDTLGILLAICSLYPSRLMTFSFD